jgi:transcriptional regulator with PAS, ATPase and Fis domain
LFLDEIGEVSPALQVRLLRVLQERTYEPLGATRSETADVRILAATHTDLSQLTRRGSFREDLYYRVNVVRVELPPLRRRKEDIPLLVEHFTGRLNRLQQKALRGINAEALSLLMAHDWPGNVRELENVIERSFILCNRGFINIEHLPEELTARARPSGSASRMKTARQLLDAQVIQSALERNTFHRLATARELGIHKSTLFRIMKKLRIALPKRDGRARPPKIE